MKLFSEAPVVVLQIDISSDKVPMKEWDNIEVE
jgi:hypothetical protein